MASFHFIKEHRKPSGSGKVCDMGEVYKSLVTFRRPFGSCGLAKTLNMGVALAFVNARKLAYGGIRGIRGPQQ